MSAALGSFLAVGVGAALGAWARWGLSLWLNPRHANVPLGTLAANLIGGYLVGLVIAWLMLHPEVDPRWRLFLVTGLLGGLTTFSSYSAEVVTLMQRGEPGWALLTAALHLAGSLLLTWLGMATVKALAH
ncbi:MAG: fluoride efflux transporter CrcB [Burkholderiales bacterium]|nr:fluoride efflux transporter CrcB [Burkholderiales bacterium]